MFTTERDYGLGRTLFVRIGMGQTVTLRIHHATRRLPEISLSEQRTLKWAASLDEHLNSRAAGS